MCRIPGLLEYITGFPREYWEFYSVIPEDKGLLGGMKLPRSPEAPDRPGALAVRRHILQQELNDFAQKMGIAVKWGYELQSLSQDDEGVTLKFANGEEARSDFVVGCDGLHSATRRELFGEQPADYTGLVTVGVLSCTTSLHLLKDT